MNAAHTVRNSTNRPKAIQAVACSHVRAPYPQPRPQSLGASTKAESRATQGFQRDSKSFLLDLAQPVCSPVQNGATRTMAPGQSFRPLRHSFQSLVTDLSTGRSDIFRSYTCVFKQVDKGLVQSAKSRWSKNNRHAASHVNKGLQRATPTLPTAGSTADGDKSKL